MNNYCVNLNIKIPLFVKEFNIETLKLVHHTDIPAEVINPLLYRFFEQKGLRIELAESFFIPKFGRVGIHEDGGNKLDVLKINWIYGGIGSTMNWYTPIADPLWKTTILGIRYKEYNLSQVKLVHSQSVGFPSLVQVGCPHGVFAGNQERLCVSIVPAFKESLDTTIKFNDGLELFKDCI
jgi:hypothetical protein